MFANIVQLWCNGVAQNDQSSKDIKEGQPKFLAKAVLDLIYTCAPLIYSLFIYLLLLSI